MDAYLRPGRYISVLIKPVGHEPKTFLVREGTTLGEFLKKIPNLKTLIKKEKILVNGLTKSIHYPLRERDIISIISITENFEEKIQKRNANGQTIEVFMSYAMVDSKRFQVPKIADGLERKSINLRVNYWEGWNSYPNGDIIDFMEQKVKGSEIFIPICTKASKESANCEKERKMASYQNKKVIPIFKNIEFIPEIFKYKKGINVSNKKTSQIIEELYTQIASMVSLTTPKSNLDKRQKK